MNCRYYDSETGWCKHALDWSDGMARVEYCDNVPCLHYQRKANVVTPDLRYNVGDRIWFPYCFYDKFYPCQNGGVISEIDIRINSTGMHISYIVIIDNSNAEDAMFESYPDDMCFVTYEACAEWCDRRNKEY